MIPFKLLRLSISTLRQYRALPEEQRLTLREDAQRVRELTVRLGGARVRQMLAGDGLLGPVDGGGDAPRVAAAGVPSPDPVPTDPAPADVADGTGTSVGGTYASGDATSFGDGPTSAAGPVVDDAVGSTDPADVAAADPAAAEQDPAETGPSDPTEAETIEELRDAVAALAISIAGTGIVGGDSRSAALGRRLLRSGVVKGRFGDRGRDG
ncbi:MAG: hypothetical protein M0P31_00305 [Solirubrobacteraceae bacterium]|nr:hypothetical protein [Solirubrobacteraceae bacterium]